MSTIKVDTIATRTGSGNITLSNSLASATIAGDLTVNGNDISTAGSMVLKPAGTEIVNINNTGDVIVKGQGSNRGMLTLRAGSNTSNSQLRFGDQASDSVGRIMYDHSDDTMRFQTNGSERVRISAAGLAIGGTGAANTLDDYEEGTWTPTFSAGISSPVYSIQSGRYTKVGRAVYVESDIRVTGGSATSAHVYMGGLPFTVSSAAPYSKLDIIYQGGFHNISYPSVWLCIAGTTTAAFYRNTDGGAILGNQITSSFTNATIRIGGWYIT